jgi:predicted lipid carrier protein YhbT
MARIDPIAEFMEGLASRGHEPSLAKATGTLRFEVVDGKQTERWLLTVTKGDLAVSRRNARADVTLRAPRSLFAQLVQGKMNATAAFLRGALHVEGDVELIVLVQRLLPGPAASRPKGRAAGWATRKR